MILLMGGRSFAYVPGPLRWLARRRGGAVGSGCGVLFFPGVVGPLVGFEGGPRHHLDRGGLVAVTVKTLPQGLELWA
jgi:hypothetical protein